MTFLRPTLPAIRDRVGAELGDAARLPGTAEHALSRAIAGASHEQHAHIAWVARQVLVITADADRLDLHGDIWGVPRRGAAPAAGVAALTGADGAVVPAGTELRRADGRLYNTLADGVMAGGTALVLVAAAEPGAAGDTPPGVALSLVAPIAGITGAAVADDGSGNGLTAGADTETDEPYRARILARIQQPPMGGAAHDYVAWALQVPGVARAWCLPWWQGIGTVAVTFLTDDSDDPIPSQLEVAAVQAHIDGLRPVSVKQFLVFATAPEAIDVTVLISPDSAAVRAAVQAELADAIVRQQAPGATVRKSILQAAVSAAAGEDWHSMTAPAGDVTVAPGAVPVPGAVVFGVP